MNKGVFGINYLGILVGIFNRLANLFKLFYFSHPFIGAFSTDLGNGLNWVMKLINMCFANILTELIKKLCEHEISVNHQNQ